MSLLDDVAAHLRDAAALAGPAAQKEIFASAERRLLLCMDIARNRQEKIDHSPRPPNGWDYDLLYDLFLAD